MAAVPLDRAVGGAAAGRELGLEGVDVGPQRGDPVGVEGRQQHGALLGAHVGRRQPQAIAMRHELGALHPV
jgi:hypothetical protein